MLLNLASGRLADIQRPETKSSIRPGHALHEKGLQRQIGVGTLVSSQNCRSVSIRRAPSAPAAAPAAESLHASTAFARVTGWNNQLQRLPPAVPRLHPTGTGYVYL